MPKYNVITTVTQTRSYVVDAEDYLEAESLLRDEYRMIPYDIIDEELDDVEVEG